MVAHGRAGRRMPGGRWERGRWPRGRRAGGRRLGRHRGGVGAAGVATVVVVGALWWWSAGAADPLAPGPTPPGASSVGGLLPTAAPAESGEAPTRDGGDGDRGARTGDAVGGDASALEVVRTAARAAATAPTARFSLTVALADEPATAPITEATGVVDVPSGRVAMSLRQWDPAVAAAPTTIEAVGVDEDLFVRSSALDPPGEPASWWRMRVGGGDQAAPAGVSGLVSLVEAAVAAEGAGRGLEDGVEVDRYRVRLSDRGAVGGVAVEESGWAIVGITASGALRAIEVRGAGAWGTAAGRGVVVRLVLDGLGKPVEITAPAADEVRDAPGLSGTRGG